MKKIILICFLSLYGILTNTLFGQNELPDREQRIYTLSLIWKELSYNFAFPENLHKANLDSLYLDYLPRIEQAENKYNYYRLLSSFMAHFNEAHTRIFPFNRPDDTLPIEVVNFKERVIVSNVEKIMADQIPLKSEIIQINGKPVAEYLRDSIYPYIAAATSQWKLDKAVSEMFYGVPQSIVELKIKTLKGEERNVQMIRNFNSSRPAMLNDTKQPPIEIQILEGNIGYMHLWSFIGGYTESINQIFNSYLPKLKNCNGFIIDLRGNRGGSDVAWERIASHFIAEKMFDIPVKCYSRINIATYKNWGQNSDHPRLQEFYQGLAMDEIEHGSIQNEVDDSLKLHQPMVVISGYHVASAAEDFLLLMKDSGRAIVVGEPSVGCVGEPTLIKIPGDLGVMICSKKYVRQDGTQPNDMGILPNIHIERDREAYLKGEDNILQQAIEKLSLIINKK